MFEDKNNNKKEENIIIDKVNNYNFDINKFLAFDINNKNFKITNKGEIRLKPDSNFFEGKTIFKGIKISYDELLEIFKEKKLVTDPEYSILKSNYEPVNYYNNEAVIKDGSLFENMIQDIINFDHELCLLDSKIYSSNRAIKDLEEKFTSFTSIICQLKDEISDLKREIETLKENNNIENEQIEKKTHYNIIIKI